jgi:hypothetical protein
MLLLPVAPWYVSESVASSEQNLAMRDTDNMPLGDIALPLNER